MMPAVVPGRFLARVYVYIVLIASLLHFGSYYILPRLPGIAQLFVPPSITRLRFDTEAYPSMVPSTSLSGHILLLFKLT